MTLQKYFLISLLITFINFYTFLTIYGYEAVYIPAIITGIFLGCFNSRLMNLKDFIFINILFLIIFDNEKINISEYRIRIWYIPYIVLVCVTALKEKSLYSIRFRNLWYALSFLYYAMYLFAFLIIDDNPTKIYIIKYILFNLLFLVIFVKSMISLRLSLENILFLFYWIVTFVVIWGIFQFVSNLNGSGELYQHDWYNVSPSAFFDERTWYGQYAAIGFVSSIFFYLRQKKNFYILISIACMTAIGLSFSRSAIIPLLSVCLCALFVKLQRKHLIGTTLLMFLTLLTLTVLPVEIFSKFSLSETGVISRIEAFVISYKDVLDDPVSYLYGHGFKWNSFSTEGGTAIGAKAANYLIMIMYIFGYFGLLFAIFLSVDVFFRFIVRIRSSHSPVLFLAFFLYTSFISLSFFVPAHQYPPTLILLGLSLGVLLDEEKKFR